MSEGASQYEATELARSRCECVRVCEERLHTCMHACIGTNVQAEEDILEDSEAAAAQQHHHQQGSLSQLQQGQPRLVQPCPSRPEQSALLLPAESWPEAAVYDHCHVALHLRQHVRSVSHDKLLNTAMK